MTAPHPVAIRPPEIGALVAGRMTVLIRPIGRLASAVPGDLLWIREPFHLLRTHDRDAPTRAAELGAVPVFAVDHKPAWFKQRADTIGRARFAREMPKVWHRQHLRITALDRVQLHDVAPADLRRAGWRDFEPFRLRWDADARFAGMRLSKQRMWSANPQILRIQFERIAQPITFASESDRDGAIDKPWMRKFAAPDRSACPTCGARRDRGCEHFPISAKDGGQ